MRTKNTISPGPRATLLLSCFDEHSLLKIMSHTLASFSKSNPNPSFLPATIVTNQDGI
ncbi:hypothetical protein BDV27DRAFT_124885 [Aspergillus caelatus]|uniref:Uncharacterized protein n=1 Tax=Aspergillus caelatus TaxID=61420 RepID=A0A5N7ABN2_9EURO|nr:uncharacterized protein BDV27DRAFT_124885 [Aspergillus caelatus]KAE8366728.1 hypothetical protein BDV27DRAFT_124885 [Aspergillus caelatus]